MKLLIEDDIFLEKGKKIASELSLEIISSPNLAFTGNNDHCMYYGALGLGFISKEAVKPIIVDFDDPKLRYRIANVRQESILKAIKIKNIPNPTLIDATAGMGEDSILMAAAGYDVLMMERSVFIGAMLIDGLTRAKSHQTVFDYKVDIIIGNSIELLKNYSADVIYLDPMFPSRVKSALVRKEMRLFKSLVGEDLDADKLLEAALLQAKHKVVVKRPIKAPALANHNPTYVIEGKVCRFDVYQTAKN